MLTECIKNAAKHLGNIFGRNLNRKLNTVDTYRPIVTIQHENEQKAIEATKQDEVVITEEVTIQQQIDQCGTVKELAALFEKEVNNLSENDKKAFTAKKLKLRTNGGK